MLLPARVRERLREALWVIPAAAVAVGLALGFVLVRVDVDLGGVDTVLFSGGPDEARTILSVLVGALVTVTGLVFSSTVVALQIASQQFSPRLLRTFLRDRGTQGVLGALLGTTAYDTAVLAGLPSTQAAADHRVAVTLAIGLALAAIGVLVYFIAHITRSIRVEAIMLGVQRETATAIARIYVLSASPPPPQELPEPPRGAVPLLSSASGYVRSVDVDALLAAAEHAGVVLRLHQRVGSHCARGELLAWAWPVEEGAAIPVDTARLAERIAEAIDLGLDRAMVQDATFGVGQLVDMAVKALSPAVNDPRTAVEAVHHLSSLLAELGSRDTRPLVASDGCGRLRVAVDRPDFADYLALACGQIRRYGSKEPTLSQALLGMLGDASGSVHVSRRDDLLRHVDLVEADAVREVAQPADLDSVRTAADAARGRIDLLCGGGGPAPEPVPSVAQAHPHSPR